ncbi:MAG: thymidylate synthase (FAD) [Dehalococcoidia bacterium]|nr:thymidylate synthase (FAD) [Dehalococcoidia bacterium]|tara:strand:- start:1629 stop:2444 length:816 start_codon:yes stop_codon:yes gene_type:complete
MNKKKLDMLKHPKIYLTTRTSVDWNQVAEFLADQGVPPIPDSIRAGKDESAAVVEISARMCYMSYGRGRKDIADFINNLLYRKDGSVLEHVNFGFVITGISRSLTHELIRHRAGFAYSQRSQRYVDESGASFVIPPALVNETFSNDKVNEVFNKAMENASTSYEELVNSLEESLDESLFEKKTDRRKAIRQAARSVLPNATETKLFVTANVRAWRHFIEMRSTPYADWEIRRMAIQILNLLVQEAPLLFGDFKIEELPDGTSIAAPLHSKV